MGAPIDGSVTMVTGASSGIGREIARQLAGRVKALVLVARREDRLRELADELQTAHPSLEVVVEACDLADRIATDQMIDAVEDQVGSPDILINNAGFGDMSMFDWADWDKLDRMIRLNVGALCYLTHRLVQPMVAKRSGGVLMVSSGLGLMFLPAMATYVGSKHFVTAFTESLRLDVKAMGVVITQVCPGPVATEFDDAAATFFDSRLYRWTFEISAAQCAASSLRAFDRGRALVVPGIAFKLLMFMTGLTPRWLLRLSGGIFANKLRQVQHARRAKQLDDDDKPQLR